MAYKMETYFKGMQFSCDNIQRCQKAEGRGIAIEYMKLRSGSRK